MAQLGGKASFEVLHAVVGPAPIPAVPETSTGPQSFDPDAAIVGLRVSPFRRMTSARLTIGYLSQFIHATTIFRRMPLPSCT
jgi:hypothetical protein